MEIPRISDEDAFDPEFSHPDLNIVDNYRTAVVVVNNDETQLVIGRNIYYIGEHDIQVRLDHFSIDSIFWIGTTTHPYSTLDTSYHLQGFSG